MPTLKLSLDQETMDALDERAKLNLRYADQQAVALLRQSLGLPIPYEPAEARRQAENYAAERNRKGKIPQQPQ